MSFFARKLRQLRHKAGLSQYRLAVLSGLTPQALSLLELGSREPSWDTVVRISAALDVSCEVFVDEDFELPDVPPPRPRGRPRKEPPKGGPNK